MTSALRRERPCNNGAFVAPSGHSTEHNSSEEIDKFFTPFPDLKEFVPTPEDSVLLESFTLLDLFIVLFLVPKYSEDNLQEILKVVLKAQTSAVAASL